MNQSADPLPDDSPPHASETPVRERRASHRVDDDQKSGEGSLTALSKLRMIERKLAAWRAMRKES